MLEYYIYRIYPWAIVTILLVAFALVRWFYFRKFKSDKIKRGDIVHNLTDGTKSIVAKVNSPDELISKTLQNNLTGKIINKIKLPNEFSNEEMEFIEGWYSEKGMQQLLQANGKKFKILKDKPPVPGCSYVRVDAITVLVVRRNNVNLKPYEEQVLKTVKLLMLDTWIT